MSVAYMLATTVSPKLASENYSPTSLLCLDLGLKIEDGKLKIDNYCEINSDRS